MQALNLLVNIILVVVIWYAAHKLTWDCTVVDESKDTSGRGLLQSIGVDMEEEIEGASVSARLDDDVVVPEAGQDVGGWWSRMIARRKRAHMPGIWVIYFCLAALPCFGLGQWLMDAENLSGRRHAFGLVMLFVASAMALLLTTNFLQLRRYLRQKRLPMPAPMAGMWLVSGLPLLLGILLLCMLLPRPHPEYSISHVDALSLSNAPRRSSPVSVGTEGTADAHRTGGGTNEKLDRVPEGDNGQRLDSEADAVRQGENGPGENGPGENGQSENGPGENGPGENGPGENGQSKNGQSKNGPGENGPGENGPGENGPGENGPGENGQRGGETEGKESGPGGESQSGGSGGESGDSSSRDNTVKASSSDESQSNGESGQDQAQGDSASNEKAESMSDGETPDAPVDEGASPDREPSNGAAKPSADQARGDRESSAGESRRSPPAWSPSRLLDWAGAGLGGLLKLVYWLVIGCAVCFIFWRYGATIIAALRQFVRDMLTLWRSLFGNAKPPAETLAEVAVAVPVATGPAFRDFRNPFLSGGDQSQSARELVRYTFEALEAWARERGCTRGEDHTPLEFSQLVGGRAPALAEAARQLANLYNRAAYATESLPASCHERLRLIWQLMGSGRY